MALNDDAVLVPNSGNYLTAPVGTAVPVDLRNPASPWEAIGHTSIDDILSFASEGGEATVLQTLQNKSLRTRYSARTETMSFTVVQWDEANLKRYFGSNMIDLTDDEMAGWLGVPENPTPTQEAFLGVFIDGLNVFGIYAPKAEIFRGDDLSIADTESLAGMPLGIRPMKAPGNDWTYALTPLGSV